MFPMSFDLIATTETWTSSEAQHYVLPEYNLFYTDRYFSRGSGVALYVKNNINNKLMDN